MTKHKSHDERRHQILEAARNCFIRSGYAHTRVDDIANEAGLSKGGIYFHFKSKREIFDALLEAQQERTMDLVRLAESHEGTAADRLSRLATVIIEQFADIDDQRKLLIVLAEMGMRDTEVHDRIIDAHQRYVDALANQLRGGVAEGEFRDIDPNALALFLKLLVDGVEQGIALGYDVEPMQLLKTGLDVVFHGIIPRDG